MGLGASSGKALLIAVLLLASAVVGLSAFWFLGDVDRDGIVNYKDERPFENDVLDTDGDGLPDTIEKYKTKTDPNKWDTDGDGLSDGDEINTYGTNPLNPDCDGDGLLDGEEVLVYGTNPFDKDTDDDGWLDPEDVNPTVADFYENVAARVGEPIAIQLMACYEGEGGPERVKNATLALAELSEEDRQILYDCGIIGSITEDGQLSDEELAYFADVDRDGLPNPEDELGLNPLNDGKRSYAARLYMAKAAWFLSSCPRYGPTFLMGDVYGLEGMKLLLDALDEGAIIAEDFSPRECHIGFLMATYPHARELLADPGLTFLFRPAVKQIRMVCYQTGLVRQKADPYNPTSEQLRQSEIYCWEKFIDPAIELKLKFISEDGGWPWLRNLTQFEQGKVLLPKELCWIDLAEKNGRTRPDGTSARGVWHYPSIDVAIRNVQPCDEFSGKSPLEHFRDLAKQHFEAKDEVYEDCIIDAHSTFAQSWPHCKEAYQSKFDYVLSKDPLHSFTYGFGYWYTMDEPITGNRASVIAATNIGRPAWVVTARYPGSSFFTHDEPAIKTFAIPDNNGYYYPWFNQTAWEQDYIEKGDTPPPFPQVPPMQDFPPDDWQPQGGASAASAGRAIAINSSGIQPGPEALRPFGVGEGEAKREALNLLKALARRWLPPPLDPLGEVEHCEPHDLALPIPDDYVLVC